MRPVANNLPFKNTEYFLVSKVEVNTTFQSKCLSLDARLTHLQRPQVNESYKRDWSQRLKPPMDEILPAS